MAWYLVKHRDDFTLALRDSSCGNYLFLFEFKSKAVLVLNYLHTSPLLD
jgi:hypothetical protein